MREQTKQKKQSGIPCGNAGEYFVMGELLRRGYDAQLADRNTKGYDMLVGKPEQKSLRKIQVKSARTSSWFVRQASFEKNAPEQVTVYVLVGSVSGKTPVRFFIANNRELTANTAPRKWHTYTTISIGKLKRFENRWEHLLK
jgi:hypothetical protein